VSTRGRGLALAIAAAACLAAAPLAAADRLGWNEKAKYAGKPVMSYRVVSLTLGKSRWNAHVSFRNLSNRTIRVGNEFGVGFWTSSKATDLADAVGFAAATTFSSKPPTALKPGDSWSGVISGHGRLTNPGRLYARVVFGPFIDFPGQSTAVLWITDHAKALGARQIAPRTTVPGTVI
jgi:hypothetical protein